MRGRKKLLSLVSLLSVLLIISVVLGFGVVDVSKFSLGSSSASSTVETASSSTPQVFVDPDYILDDTKQSGSLVSFHVNVSDVTDLFAWQVNVTWDSAILNVTRIIPGEFLARAADLTSSEILGFVINSTGSVVAAEAIMADTTGITGNGRLVTIEFEIVGYGCTDINIGVSGTMPAMLLNSTGSSMTFTTTDGYFRNKYPGDVDGDKYVGSADFSVLAGAYGSSDGEPAYDREADFDLDGYVGSADFSALAGNYGKTFP